MGVFPSLLCLTLLAPPSPGAEPAAERREAIRRGIAFVESVAANPENFAAYGPDLLWCLYSWSATSADPQIRRAAAPLARSLAQQWLALHPTLPPNADPDDLVDFATAAYAANRLGVKTPGLRRQMSRRARQIPVWNYYRFDPRKEPPPNYDLWCDALITAQAGQIMGVKLGAAYAQIIRWLPAMRPYPPRERDPRFYATLYSITHLVYTLDNYSAYAVSPDCLRPEYEYLKANLDEAIRRNDPETMGEFLDALRSFGMTDRDAPIQRGVAFLLRTQNADGSWGSAPESDVYSRYHSTWTAVDGLRIYRFKPARACPVVR